MKWKEVPVESRRYIIYHTIISPLLITWYMLPASMLMTGYSILEIGVVFTSINIASIPLTYLIGSMFDRIAIRHGLILIDLLDGLENILYGLSFSPLGPLVLSLGLIVGRVTRLFYPLYQATEKLIYPEDRLEKIFAWHMRLPLLSQLIGFIILGYILGVIFTMPIHYETGFIIIGASSIFTVLYLIKYVPKLDVKERMGQRGFAFKFDKEFKAILTIQALDILASYLAAEIVLLNYMIIGLGLSFFHVMVVVAFSLIAGAILATHVSEHIAPVHKFKVITLDYVLRTAWALIMFLSPNFVVILIAYFIAEFGHTLAFPFYRSWLFSKVPRGKASSLLAGISSFDRTISIVAPFLAGLLASLDQTLPYLASLILFMAAVPILLSLQRAQ